ncbi:hypothetical protein H6789_02710 [Candidatus Nomurabacteria bacterium]|nr:hypothetical protein [Candidatus Nomurabacteria bacterium]MCB9819588.1 hypothetical protein [Candidatus Nomurabacteria bacterium]
MEKITLKLFWSCMIICASIIIAGIWLGEFAPEALFKTAATFFIVGLANFLLWGPTVTYRLLGKLS